MQYYIICVSIGLLVGWFVHYIFAQKPVGVIKMIDHEEAVSMFLELEKDLPQIRSKKKITLRVENSSYNENQY